MGNCCTCYKGEYVEIIEDDSEDINAETYRQDRNLGAELDMPPHQPLLQPQPITMMGRLIILPQRPTRYTQTCNIVPLVVC